jgi:thiol:disulfide interchange protein
MDAVSVAGRIQRGEVHSVHSSPELHEILSACESLLVVLFCKARRCMSCKFFNKKFLRVASHHPNVVFLELMCDESEDTIKLMQELDVPVVPHFIMYHRGCERTRLSSTSEEKLENTISKCEHDALAFCIEGVQEVVKGAVAHPSS